MIGELCGTAVYLCTSHEMDGVSGRYYKYGKENPPKLIYDADFGARVWEKSAGLPGVDIPQLYR